MIYNNGDIYKGDWKNNLREAKGKMRYKDIKEEFEGILENDKEIKGIIYYDNWDKYEGEYKNNLREGKGTYYYNNGEIYDGEYKNDSIVKGKGEFIFPNYIICEYNIIKKENIQILSSNEEMKRNNNYVDWNSIEEVKNEEEIRKNCELYLN